MGGGDCALMGMIGAFFGWESVWPVLALGAFIGVVLHVPVALRRRAPPEQGAGDEPGAGLRWGQLFKLLAAGLVLVALMGVAVRVGVIGGMLRTAFYAVLGAGAAYYASFLLPKRMLDSSLAQVWGLIGAGIGIAIGTARWMGILGGLALGGGALAWASRRMVTGSPAGTDELSAQGYLPFEDRLRGREPVVVLPGAENGVEREMLALERVDHLVGEHEPQLGPVGALDAEEHGRIGVVEAGDLFGVEVEQERSEMQRVRQEAEEPVGGLQPAQAFRRQLLVQFPDQVVPHLLAASHRRARR